MKKLLALALAALLLTGCAAESPAPTEPSLPETTPATEEVIITHESVELLEFDYEDAYAAAPMGEDLLLFCNMDKTTLVKISGRNHKELASISTGVPVNPGTSTLQISESGVCYATEEEYIFLDENLEEIDRITLPDAWGRGAVTADQQTIYYSTGSELWVYSRENGLHRPLRETLHTGLILESLELNDSVLVCQVDDATLFYSTATGELLYAHDVAVTLSSAGDLWLAKTSDGGRNQIAFGGGAEPQALKDFESFADVTLVSGGVLITSQTEETHTIRFLNLTDSTEAAIALDGDAFVTNAWNDSGILWISFDDGRLLRWEPEDADMQAASCIAPYFSRENPDTEGLAALEPTIAQLEDTYGVKIHIFEDAVVAQPVGITLSSEYQVETLTEGLSALELALSRFTPEFLAKAGKASGDGKVHISLVRAVTGEGCIQFWDAGIAHIILEVNDDLQRNFFHGIGHIIDARVLTECTALDGWKSLNPQGFSYLYDYTAEADTAAFPGAFADSIGMVSPVEDRASVFTAAMQQDAGDTFESGTMQRKLSTLCNGIRKAFGMKNAEEPLPWEQYLAE